MNLPSSRQANLLTFLYGAQVAEVLVKCPGATAVAVSLPSAPGPATDNDVSLTLLTSQSHFSHTILTSEPHERLLA